MNIRRSATWLIDNDPDGLRKYIDGVRALKQKTRRGSNLSVYDELVGIHKGVASLPFDATWLSDVGGDPSLVTGLATGPAAGVDGGHRGPAFLPWHRVYLRRLEVEIQVVLGDPDATIPYWDWTDHAGTEKLFTEEFLGAGSQGPDPGPIPAGWFTGANWPVRADLQYRFDRMAGQVSTLGTALVRNSLDFNALPVATEVDDALGQTDYDDFRRFLEGEGQRLHDYVHGWAGGSMAMMSSPNDPMFFLHHAFIDYVWAQWQKIRREAWLADEANAAQTYDPTIHYSVPAQTPYGHNLYDRMWPWDVGSSQPAVYLPAQNPYPVLQGFFLTADVPVGSYSLGDRMRPVDTLDHEAMGYTYEPL